METHNTSFLLFLPFISSGWRFELLTGDSSPSLDCNCLEPMETYTTIVTRMPISVSPAGREKIEASIPGIAQLYGGVVQVRVGQAGQDGHKRLDARKHCKYLQIY